MSGEAYQFPIKPKKRKNSREHIWPSPIGFCLWCGTKLKSREELPKGKKRYYSKYFCPWDKTNKQDCSYQYNSHFVWSSLRERILERDNHTCQKCGYKHPFPYTSSYPKFSSRTSYEGLSEFWNWKQRFCEEVFGIGHFPSFEVDHIKAVALGGDYWDWNNLWTLCELCHREKTNKDVSRITFQKKQTQIFETTGLIPSKLTKFLGES